MRTITALFDTRDQAHQAVSALHDAGIPDGDISLVSNNADDDDAVAEGAGTGAGFGAAIGGTGGLLAGLGAIAVPGIGPVVAGGWLLATAIGAVAGAAVGGAAGGIVGALADAGVPEDDAHVYAEGVRRGGSMVTARVEDEKFDAAAAILRHSEEIDISERRRLYEAEGWEGFDPDAPAYTPEQVRDYRTTYASRIPPIV